MAAGKIVAYVLAKTEGFTGGMKRSKRELKSFEKRVDATSRQLVKFGAAATAAAAAAAVAMLKAGLDNVDAQAKMARSVSGTIGSLEGLQRAAKDSGVDVGALNSSAQRLQVSLGEARLGAGRAKETLDALGLSASELAALDVGERFATLSDAMRDAGMTGDQMSASLAALGIRNRDMVLLVQQGGGAIRDATEEVKGYGLAIDAVDAAMIESLNDQLSRGRDMVRGVANQFAVNAAPAIQAVVNLLGDATKETQGFSRQSSKMVDLLVSGAARVAKLFQDWKIFIAGIKVAYRGLERAIIGVAEIAVKGWEKSAEIQVGVVNKMIRVLNRLPWNNIPELIFEADPALMAAFEGMVADSEKALAESVENLKRLAQEPLASETVKKAYRDALDDRERIATEYGDREAQRLERERLAQLAAEREKAAELARIKYEETRRLQEAERSRLHGSLDSLQAYLRTEEENIHHHYALRIAMLQELRENQLGVNAEFDELERKLAEDHQRSLDALRQEGVDAQVGMTKESMFAMGSIVAGGMESISRIMDKESRAAFNINKAAGIVNATISTLEAINKNLTIGGPAGVALATAAGIAGFANVAAIAAQTFGGSGTRSAAYPQAQGAQTQTVRREITLRGDSPLTADLARQMIPLLNDAFDDGAIFR